MTEESAQLYLIGEDRIYLVVLPSIESPYCRCVINGRVNLGQKGEHESIHHRIPLPFNSLRTPPYPLTEHFNLDGCMCTLSFQSDYQTALLTHLTAGALHCKIDLLTNRTRWFNFLFLGKIRFENHQMTLAGIPKR